MKFHTRRLLGRTAVILALVVFLAAGGFVAWALSPLGPEPSALKALEPDSDVDVVARPEGYVFSPKHDATRVGLVLYPGGHVDPRSYAPLAHDVATHGYLVVVQPMPLNLAVLASKRARAAIDAHPEMTAWAIGGHSLGGAMAARFAAQPQVHGLALLASYPPPDIDLSARDLEVMSIWGTRDGILDMTQAQAARARLPRDADFVTIAGGNHAQFGAYGRQPGDRTPEIGADEQREITVRAILQMLRPIRVKAE